MRKSSLVILSIGSILLLAGFGCGDDFMKNLTVKSTPSPKVAASPDSGRRIGSPDVPFGTVISMTVHSKLNYADGLEVELMSLIDTRCKEGKKCADPGGVTMKLQLMGGQIGTAPKKLTLSTVGDTAARLDGYVVFLQEANATVVKLTISKTDPSVGAKP